MTRKRKLILGTLLGLPVVAGLGCVGLWIWATQSFSSPTLAVVPSPASADDALWLLTEGFQDRGITFYVASPKINGGKPKRIVDLDWDGLYSFKKLQWSDDGKLAVFVLRLADNNGSEVIGFAYDFSTDRSVLPKWQGRHTTAKKTLAEWQQHERKILRLADSHGGLAGEAIAVDDVRERSHKICFWQVPKG